MRSFCPYISLSTARKPSNAATLQERRSSITSEKSGANVVLCPYQNSKLKGAWPQRYDGSLELRGLGAGGGQRSSSPHPRYLTRRRQPSSDPADIRGFWNRSQRNL